jgi:hypothetical protein
MFRPKLLLLCLAILPFLPTDILRAQVVPVSGRACSDTFTGDFVGDVTVGGDAGTLHLIDEQLCSSPTPVVRIKCGGRYVGLAR